MKKYPSLFLSSSFLLISTSAHSMYPTNLDEYNYERRNGPNYRGSLSTRSPENINSIEDHPRSSLQFNFIPQGSLKPDREWKGGGIKGPQKLISLFEYDGIYTTQAVEKFDYAVSIDPTNVGNKIKSMITGKESYVFNTVDEFNNFMGTKIIEDVVASINHDSIQYQLERGESNKEFAGYFRPSISFNASKEAFDMFFNSIYGFRGHYHVDPEAGKKYERDAIDKFIIGMSKKLNLSPIDKYSIAHENAKVYFSLDPDVAISSVPKNWPSRTNPLDQHTNFEYRNQIGQGFNIKGAWTKFSNEGSIMYKSSKPNRANDLFNRSES